MYLARTLGKRTSQDGGAANVLKEVVADGAVADVVDIVEGRGTEMLEATIGEVDVAGIAHADGTDGTLHPGLVLQSAVPRKPFLLLQLVGVDEREPALQGDVTLAERTVPAGVLERQALEVDETGAVDDDELLNALALFGGAEQETAATALAIDDRLWPGMLELQSAFGLLESDDGLLALCLHGFYAQDGDGPALVDHHFQPLRLEYLLGWRWDGDGATVGVEAYHAHHAFLGPYLCVLLLGIAADNGAWFAFDCGGRLACAAVFRS